MCAMFRADAPAAAGRQRARPPAPRQGARVVFRRYERRAPRHAAGHAQQGRRSLVPRARARHDLGINVEADLEARGVDLTVPVAQEAPLINYCAGDVERDIHNDAWRAGEVVLVISDEADREDASSDEDAPVRSPDKAAGAGVFAARRRRGPKLFRRKRERWGLLVDVPGTYKELLMRSTSTTPCRRSAQPCRVAP